MTLAIETSNFISEYQSVAAKPQLVSGPSNHFHIADNSKKFQDNNSSRPPSGSLLLPAQSFQNNNNKNNNVDKRCMTVCERWGEECMLVNQGVGAMSRKCRRTCKQFTEECF